MFLGEAVRFSAQALRANPIRSLLTGLGMVIGTASVILVVTISLTSRDYILEQVQGTLAADGVDAVSAGIEKQVVGIPAQRQLAKDSAVLQVKDGQDRRIAESDEQPRAALIERHGEIGAVARGRPGGNLPPRGAVEDGDGAARPGDVGKDPRPRRLELEGLRMRG